MLRAIAAGLSDVGLQREHNEDSYVVLEECSLFVVADGMGGHRAGDVASRMAAEAISEFFRTTASDDVTWPFHFDTNLSEEENRLLTGIRVANKQIYDRSTRSREHHNMGTTVVGCMFSAHKRKMYIAHVGDSRCYRVREGEIRQMTRDHSFINDYILAVPDLTDEQKAELPKNVITRALGMQDHVVIDLCGDESRPGDTYLLCSDGLSGMVEDAEIREILANPQGVQDACRILIERANAHGGEDNVTAVLIRLEEVDVLPTEIDPLGETVVGPRTPLDKRTVRFNTASLASVIDPDGPTVQEAPPNSFATRDTLVDVPVSMIPDTEVAPTAPQGTLELEGAPLTEPSPTPPAASVAGAIGGAEAEPKKE